MTRADRPPVAIFALVVVPVGRTDATNMAG